MVWLSLFMYDHYSLTTSDYHLFKLLYRNTILRIQYVIQGHMHRLYRNTMHKNQTFDPQMYP